MNRSFLKFNHLKFIFFLLLIFYSCINGPDEDSPNYTILVKNNSSMNLEIRWNEKQKNCNRSNLCEDFSKQRIIGFGMAYQIESAGLCIDALVDGCSTTKCADYRFFVLIELSLTNDDFVCIK